MSIKDLTMKLYRPKIGVGAKTLMALSVIFWIPMLVLVCILFVDFKAIVQDEMTDHVRVNLKAANGILDERVTVLKGLLKQVAKRPDVRQAFVTRDSSKLQTLLLDFGKNNSFVNILFDVDENQRIISRRSDHRGDIANIGDVLSRALLNGEVISSMELVSRDFLARESQEMANLVNDIGLVQFVVAPVRQGDTIIGGIIGGILLSGDPWLGNTVYDRYGIELAVFAGNTPESFFVHAAASLPRNTWALDEPLPTRLKDELSLGKPYYGPLVANDRNTTVAYEPIMDSRNRIIGAFGVNMAAENVDAIVMSALSKAIIITALLGLVIAILLVLFVYHDITRPMKLLIEAMTRFGHGDMAVSVNINTGDQFETLGEGFNSMADGIRKREERYRKNNQVAKLFMSTLDLDELLDQTLNIVVEVTESQMGIIYLWENDQELLSLHAQYGTQAGDKSFAMGEGYPGRVAKNKQRLILSPQQGDQSVYMEMGFAQTLPKQAAYIPLVYQENTLGVLVLGSVDNYKDDIIELFGFLANQISIALDNAIMHQQVQELSITDGLTGLYNRRYLNTRLEEEWGRSIRHTQPVTILLSDVDNFKSINDTYGHAKGDEVLRNLAAIFKANARKEDLVARYGGEEFIAVLFDTDSIGALQLAQRICDQARAVKYPGLECQVTLSIGVATISGANAGAYDELVRAADQAMYNAKVSGKDRVIAASQKAA